MDITTGIFIGLLFTGLLSALFFGCSKINKKLGLKDDNLAEEILEEVINREIGVDVDLTPGSKE